MAVLETLERQRIISSGLDRSSIAIETPKDGAFGDLSSNVAMVLSKQAKRNPRELAKYFVDQTAREKYKSVNEKELARSTIQRSANSITVVVSSEEVDSIP